MIVSGVSLNLPPVVGFVNKRFDLLGPAPEVPGNDNARNMDTSSPQEGIALQTLSLAPSEATIANANQDQGSLENNVVVVKRDYDVWKMAFDV